MEETSFKDTIYKFKSDIIKYYSVNDFSLEDIKILNILQSDAHDPNKKIILFEINNVKLVYKPRSADSDILVISLFKRINAYTKSKGNIADIQASSPEGKHILYGKTLFEYYNKYTEESKTMVEIEAIISKRKINNDEDFSKLCDKIKKKYNTKLSPYDLLLKPQYLTQDYPLLPEYIIINCDNFSIWQYIDGNLLVEYGIQPMWGHEILKDSIKSILSISDDKKLELIKKTIFLYQIINSIKLTDLHSENIIFNGSDFVPIDLEAFNFDDNDNSPIFSKEDIKHLPYLYLYDVTLNQLIDSFNQELSRVPLRYIPISAADLIQFINGTITFDEILHGFEIEAKKMHIEYDIKIIRGYIKSCQTLKTIPYFYVLNNKVGCGFPSNPFFFKTTQDFNVYIKGELKKKKTKKKYKKHKKKKHKKKKRKLSTRAPKSSRSSNRVR